MNVYSAAYLLFILVSLLFPGYVLLKKIGILSKHPGIELSFSYLVTIVLFAVLAVADYAFRFSPEVSRVICWAIILYSVIEFFRARYFNDLLKLRFPLICLVLMSVFSSAFISLAFNAKYSYIPDPVPLPNRNYNVQSVKVLNVTQTKANDNYIPYRQAQFFVNRSDPAKDSFISEWGVHFFQRTPLMGAVTANYFNLLDDKPPIAYTWSADATDPDHTYVKFQIISGVMNALFILPAFFILTKFFNRKTAIIASLFMVSSQFFLYNSVFSWPKSLAAFFILLSWLLLLEKRMRYTALAGVASGVAYLAHDLAILYIGASVLLLLCNKRIRETVVFSFVTIIFAIPWLIAASFIYHKPSSFIYYPISTRDIPQPKESQKIIHDFLHTSPIKLLSIKINNFLYLMSPYQLFTSEGGQAGFRRLWAMGLYSIPGSLGIGLIIPVVMGVVKKLGNLNFWVLVLAPVILSCLVIGWPKGLGSLHFAEAVIVLLVGLGISLLLQLKNPGWLFAAFAANCCQLVFFITYSYKFAVGGWITHPADMLRLALMASVVGISAYVIYKISREKTSKVTNILGL